MDAAFLSPVARVACSSSAVHPLCHQRSLGQAEQRVKGRVGEGDETITKPASGRPGRHPVACETLGRPEARELAQRRTTVLSRAKWSKGGWKGHGKSGLAKNVCLGAFGPMRNGLAPLHLLEEDIMLNLPEFYLRHQRAAAITCLSARRFYAAEILHRRRLYREHPNAARLPFCWAACLHGGWFVLFASSFRARMTGLASGSPCSMIGFGIGMGLGLQARAALPAPWQR